MKCALLALPLLASCFATSAELDRAVADIGERVAVVARSAEESSAAVRDAFERGEITYTQLQARLQDIRSATLDVAEDTTRQVLQGVKEAIESRPEVIAQTGADVARTIIPGPWGEILAALALAGGTYAASQRSAKEQAAQMSMQRDMARMARGEPTAHAPLPKS